MNINLFHQISTWRDFKKNTPIKSLGFVPTMGALHQGHLSLIEKSKMENERTIVSIFVNPTQFNNPQDLATYPQPLEKDIELLESVKTDYLLLPKFEDIYHDQYRYQVFENEVSKILCGESRPGHFSGVLTVVLKLLNIVQPQRAYFGEKDYQQLVLIRDMVNAFFIPTEIIGCPLIREEDGLAMSSRNQRLSPQQRELAPRLFEELRKSKPLNEIKTNLEAAGLKVDYLQEWHDRRLAAVHLGDVRLIDNVQI